MRGDLIVLLMSLWFYDAQTFDVEGNTLASSLIDYMHVHEIILLRRDNDCHDYVKMRKSLSTLKSLLFISVLSYRDFAKIAARGYENSLNPLVIIDSDDPNFDKSDLIKLSEEANLSPFKWVVVGTKCDLGEYERVKIPFNCEFIIAEGSNSNGYQLTEIYDTTTISNLMLHLGKWSQEGGLEVSQLDFFTRRSNLRGSLYNISLSTPDPCADQSFLSKSGSVAKCIHFTMMPIVAEALNFSINWIILNQEKCYGWKVLAPPYIEFSQCDIIAVGSDDCPPFIWPSFKTTMKIYAKYDALSIEWFTYIRPFSKLMWISLWSWIFLASVFSSFAELCLSDTVTSRKSGFVSKVCMKNLFLSYSAFCCQGVLREPQRTSQRILFYLMYLVPTALSPGYVACLTSYVTSKQPKLPFTDLQGLAEAEGYKLGHQAQLDLSMVVAKDSSETSRLLFGELLMPQNELPELEEEGMRRICNEKLSWLSADYIINAYPPSCPYFELSEPVIYIFTALPIVSNSAYKVLLDRIMRRLIYSGIFKGMSVRAVGKQLPLSDSKSMNIEGVMESVFLPVIIENTTSLHVILCIGIVASSFILYLEIISFKYNACKSIKKILP